LTDRTLYSSIRRMLEPCLIEELQESTDLSSTDERRRYYRLTRFGRHVAAAEMERLSAPVQQPETLSRYRRPEAGSGGRGLAV